MLLRLFGRVTIAESTLLGEIAIEIVSPFLHVRNSTVRAAASATSAVGAVTLTESEFQHWAAWLDATLRDLHRDLRESLASPRKQSPVWSRHLSKLSK